MYSTQNHCQLTHLHHLIAHTSTPSDIKTSLIFRIWKPAGLRHSDPFKSSPGSCSQLLSSSVESQVSAQCWHFNSQSASRIRVYVASVSWYLSQTHNFARLLIVATQSSHLNCPSQLKLHGNNVCDIIIAAHMISAEVTDLLYTVQKT